MAFDNNARTIYRCYSVNYKWFNLKTKVLYFNCPEMKTSFAEYDHKKLYKVRGKKRRWKYSMEIIIFYTDKLLFIHISIP